MAVGMLDLGNQLALQDHPFGLFLPGYPGRPLGPTGPRTPFSPGGPWTQICPLLVQSLCVVVWTVLVICFCISAARALTCPSEALGGRELRF